MTAPTIIAIASGKGGVGKSIITANLAIALAEAGKKTIAIDLDLGASNLHSYLGIPNKYPGIGDYLVSRYGHLDDFVLQTSIPELSFIPGDGRTPCMADIAFSEKLRLLLAVRWLKADYILLDLGGGSSFNTLDIFALAPRSIMVTTPAYPAIMNLLVFLRNFLFRAFDREFKKYPEVFHLLQEVRRVSMQQGQMTIEMMLEKITETLPEAGEKAKEICRRYQPRIIYNFCLLPEQLEVCKRIDQSSQNLLSMRLTHFGSIFEDSFAREATYHSVPLLPNYPESTIAQSIRRIAQRVIDKWQSPADDSAAVLLEETTEFYKQFKRL